MRRSRGRALLAAVAALAAAHAAPAEEPGRLGAVASLPQVGSHAVWVPDLMLGHSLLFDGDSGRVLGTLDAGTTLSPKPPLYSAARDEFYAVEIDYSRGRRGDRTDYVTIYDARSLDVTGEVVIPTRTSESAASIGYAALLDGERFLATFNQFPTPSVSITDLAERRFVEEIVTSGCAGIYPTGARSFAMLCGDGSMLAVSLDEAGRKHSLRSTERFFDVVKDPVMMAGGRDAERWVFVSFSGTAHEIVFGDSSEEIRSWPLVSDAERAAGWRPGGRQLVALHAPTDRLYVVFHEGGPGSHKDPGPEVWVYDLAVRARVARIAMPNFTAAFLGDMLGLGEGVARTVLEWVLPGGGADTIAVSQDEAPVLFARNSQLGSVAVIDARTGEHLRNLSEAGLAGMRLEVVR